MSRKYLEFPPLGRLCTYQHATTQKLGLSQNSPYLLTCTYITDLMFLQLFYLVPVMCAPSHRTRLFMPAHAKPLSTSDRT